MQSLNSLSLADFFVDFADFPPVFAATPFLAAGDLANFLLFLLFEPRFIFRFLAQHENNPFFFFSGVFSFFGLRDLRDLVFVLVASVDLVDLTDFVEFVDFGVFGDADFFWKSIK